MGEGFTGCDPRRVLPQDSSGDPCDQSLHGQYMAMSKQGCDTAVYYRADCTVTDPGGGGGLPKCSQKALKYTKQFRVHAPMPPCPPPYRRFWISPYCIAETLDVAQWLERGALTKSLPVVRFRIPLGAWFSEKYNVSPLSILWHCGPRHFTLTCSTWQRWKWIPGRTEMCAISS